MNAQEKGRGARFGLRLQAGPTGGDGSTAKTAGRRFEAGRSQHSLDVKSLIWHGNEQSSPRALAVWVSGLLRRDSRHRQRTGRQSTCTRLLWTTICGALGRPLQGAHPDEVTALAAKADLLTAGVAVDDHAKVTVEHEASLVHEASPWAVDKRAAEIVRPAPVQSV